MFLRSHYSTEHLPASWPKRLFSRPALMRRVIDAAIQVLHERGCRDFSVVAVARRAGVSRTTVYNYFGDKAGLLTLCREVHAHDVLRDVRALALVSRLAAREGCSVWPALRRTLLGLLTRRMDPDGDLYLLTAAERLRGKRPAPRLGPRAHKAQPPEEQLRMPVPGEIVRELVYLLRLGQARGEVRQDVDAAVLARGLAALFWHEACVAGPKRDEWGRDATALEKLWEVFSAGMRNPEAPPEPPHCAKYSDPCHPDWTLEEDNEVEESDDISDPAAEAGGMVDVTEAVEAAGAAEVTEAAQAVGAEGHAENPVAAAPEEHAGHHGRAPHRPASARGGTASRFMA